MLTTLRIRHLAVIDALETSFERGFNVLTGETGAGKSIIIDALHLLLGGRAQTEVVRTGFDEASVEGTFEVLDVAAVDGRLDAAGLPACEDRRLIVRRTVHREGRSRAWVNGGAASLTQLQGIVRGLVDVSGQHEHTSLLDPSQHLHLLDRFGGLDADLAAYQASYERFAAAAKALDALKMNEAERARRLDYLRFQLDEIDKLEPQVGEDELLKIEKQRLGSAEKLRENTVEAEALLYSRDGAATEQAQSALHELERAAALDPSLKGQLETLTQAVSLLTDVARDLGRYARTVHADPSRLAEIDDRLEALKRLSRKHGGDVAGVLAAADKMRAEFQALEGHEESLASAEKARQEALFAAKKLADALTKARVAAAKDFSKAVVERLADLEMKKTIFEPRLVAISGEADGAIESSTGGGRLGPRGQDAVEFLFSPNPGEEPRALERIASGGELSRVMLAIKRVLAAKDPVETYVFDEVDAGIGGATGEVVGRLIREVSKDRQVLCITHLAQIAAYADTHAVVSKHVQAGRTHSALTTLSEAEDRRREVARMLSGHVTDASLAHADELLARREPEAKPRKLKRSA